MNVTSESDSAEDLRQILPRTFGVIEGGIERRLHHGVQLYVSLRGEVIFNGAAGTDGAGRSLTADTVMLWLSSGKPLTAVMVLQFHERGELDLHAPVGRYIPEFAVNGKEQVTIWHLLTHTAGLEPVASGWPRLEWDEILDRINRAPLQEDWVPGKRAAYDPSRGWFVLGEVLRRIDSRPVDRIVREDLCEQLGMHDSWMAVPKQVYDIYGPRIARTYSLRDDRLEETHSHTPEVAGAPSPGGNFRGPARELGYFYEMLLRGGERDGRRILRPETVALMTQRHRRDMVDETFRHKVDFGLGVMIDSNHHGAKTVPYGYGLHSSERTFGHGGAQSSIGFCDPENELVVVAIANGCPGEPKHNRRFRELNTAIYEDLRLDG